MAAALWRWGVACAGALVQHHPRPSRQALPGLPVQAGPRKHSAAAGAVHLPGLLAQGFALLCQYRGQPEWGLLPPRERQAWQLGCLCQGCAWPWLQQQLQQLPHGQLETGQAGEEPLPGPPLPLLAAGVGQAQAVAQTPRRHPASHLVSLTRLGCPAGSVAEPGRRPASLCSHCWEQGTPPVRLPQALLQQQSLAGPSGAQHLRQSHLLGQSSLLPHQQHQPQLAGHQGLCSRGRQAVPLGQQQGPRAQH